MEAVRFITDVRVTPGVGRLASAMGGSTDSRLVFAALGLPLIVLFGSAVSWPVAAGMRRLRRREPARRTTFERRARWAAIAYSMLAMVFVGAFAWVFHRVSTENPFVLLVGVPGWAAPVMVLPWLLLAGSAALAAVAVLAWRRGAWTRWGRIHFTLIAVASAVLVGTLFALGLR